jgi:hypothetical protein
MTLTERFGSLSIKRTLTTGVLALAMAAGASAQFGGAEAHAFSMTANDNYQIATHTSGKATYCASGMVAIRAGSLWIDHQGWVPTSATYTVSLFGWTTTGWQLRDTKADREPDTLTNKQLTFPNLPSGSYTVMLKVTYDSNGSYMGSSTWAPLATDFWFAPALYQGIQYCTI